MAASWPTFTAEEIKLTQKELCLTYKRRRSASQMDHFKMMHWAGAAAQGWVFPAALRKKQARSIQHDKPPLAGRHNSEWLVAPQRAVLQGGKHALGLQRQTQARRCFQPRCRQYVRWQGGLSWRTQVSPGALAQAARLQQCQCRCVFTATKPLVSKITQVTTPSPKPSLPHQHG